MGNKMIYNTSEKIPKLSLILIMKHTPIIKRRQLSSFDIIAYVQILGDIISAIYMRKIRRARGIYKTRNLFIHTEKLNYVHYTP